MKFLIWEVLMMLITLYIYAQIDFTTHVAQAGTMQVQVENASKSMLTVNTDQSPNQSATSISGLIAFTSDRDGNQEIYVMNADGTNPRNLTNHMANDSAPTWSPDGTQIVFTSFRDDSTGIYVMNTDGSNLRNLTNNIGSGNGSTWSPDGAQIAFTSTADGNYKIYVMNADGSNLRRLTNNPAWESAPTWCTQIAFRSDRDGNQEIYVMNADGTNPYNITNNSATDRDSVRQNGSPVHVPMSAPNRRKTIQLISDGSMLFRKGFQG